MMDQILTYGDTLANATQEELAEIYSRMAIYRIAIGRSDQSFDSATMIEDIALNAPVTRLPGLMAEMAETARLDKVGMYDLQKDLVAAYDNGDSPAMALMRHLTRDGLDINEYLEAFRGQLIESLNGTCGTIETDIVRRVLG